MPQNNCQIVKVMDSNFKTTLDYCIEVKEAMLRAGEEKYDAVRKELAALKLVRDIRDGRLLVSAADGGSVSLSFS